MFSFIYGLGDGSDATRAVWTHTEKYDCMKFRLPNTIVIVGNSSRCPRVYAFSIIYFLVSFRFLTIIDTQPTTQRKTKITTTTHTQTHIHFFWMQRIVFSNARLSSAAVCLPLSAWMFRHVCVCAIRICREQNGVCVLLMHSGPFQYNESLSIQTINLVFFRAWKAANERQHCLLRAHQRRSLLSLSLTISTFSWAAGRQQQVKWALTKCSRRIVWHSRKKSFAIETVGRLNRALVNGIRVS